MGIFRFLLILFFTVSFARADDLSVTSRRISIDTQYGTIDSVSSPVSNRALGDFMTDFFDFNGFVFDQFDDLVGGERSAFIRVPSYLAFQTALFLFVQEPLALAYHELGHATQIRALGFHPVYKFDGSDDSFSNFWTYAFNGMGDTDLGGTVTPGTEIFATNHPDLALESGFGELNNPRYLVGGLNNEMLLAENLEEKSLLRNGHIMEGASYVLSKAAAPLYIVYLPTVGDIVSAKNYYQSKNYKIDESDIEQASFMSLFLSSTSYAYAWNVFQYFLNGSTEFKHFTYEGFKIPDLSFFLSTQGINHKINLGYHFDSINLWLLPSYEFVAKGGSGFEFTVDLIKEGKFWGLPSVYRLAPMIGEKSFSMNASLTSVFAKVWSATLGVSRMDARGFWGERNIASYKNGNVAHTGWIKLAFSY